MLPGLCITYKGGVAKDAVSHGSISKQSAFSNHHARIHADQRSCTVRSVSTCRPNRAS